MEKKKFFSRGRGKFYMKRVGDHMIPIPTRSILTDPHPESGVPIRYCEGDGIRLHIDGGVDHVSDAVANGLVPAFLVRCDEKDIDPEEAEECIIECCSFLVEKGYGTENANVKQILVRAIAQRAAHVETFFDERGVRKYRGGIREIWPELAMNLSTLFLERFGVARFREKIQELHGQWRPEDVQEMTDFLIEHNISPNTRNIDTLVRGLVLELLIPKDA